MSSIYTCYPPIVRTATPNPQMTVQGNVRGARGLLVVIDVSLVPGSAPSVVFTVEGYDPLSGKYFTVLASAAITGVGTTVLRVFPGATAVTNLAANDCLPARWRVKAVHGNANSVTYSVSAIELF